MLSAPLHISAMTLSCAAGTGLRDIRHSLAGMHSGLRPNDFPHCQLSTWIGRVNGVEDTRMSSELAHLECRNNQLAELALRQDDFLARAADLVARHGAQRVACVIGTSTAGIGSTEAAYRELDDDGEIAAAWLTPYVHNPHTSAIYVAERLGLKGPVLTVSTACSSSAKVFASAARLIATGMADAAVVGGVDSLCLSVLYGFQSLELVSPDPCRPFDKTRRGLSLGEAAGFALLERDSKRSQGRLLGWGESSDAHHMASPHPEGRGAIDAVRAALNCAGLPADSVGYINCHGTATPLNDQVEGGVIRSLFTSPPPASSTKGWTGHTLGAAGITEAVFSLLAMQDGVLPPTLNCTDVEAENADFVLTEPLQRQVDVVLSNSFGFGGSNCALLLGRA